jgi:hypothetical protein
MNQFETIWAANRIGWRDCAGPRGFWGAASVFAKLRKRRRRGDDARIHGEWLESQEKSSKRHLGKCRNNKLTTLCRRLAPNLSFRINFNALGRIARSGPTAETATPRKVRSANRS